VNESLKLENSESRNLKVIIPFAKIVLDSDLLIIVIAFYTFFLLVINLTTILE